METGCGSFREGLFQLRNGSELSVFDRFVDPGKILIHDPTGTEIEVPDLGISHLAFRQPNVQSAAAEVSYRIRFVHFFPYTACWRDEGSRPLFPPPLVHRDCRPIRHE